MNRIVSFLQSSLGKKILMSLTGLFLCTFLVEHLVGNLLLLVNDGGVLYDKYSELMVSNPVIRTIEIVLFASLIGHAISGFVVWLQNRRARPEKYESYKLSDNTPLASRITMITGSIVLLFLIVHLRTFFVPARFGSDHPSMYLMVQEAFSSPWYSGFYIVALVLLAYHLRHGFQSAFQTLGLRGKRYDGILDAVAFVFWFILPLGFAVIPVYFYFFHRASGAAFTLGLM